MCATSIRSRLLTFFSFQPGEARPALLLTIYLLLAIASAITLKAARNSLFLARFSARELPFVYLAIAVLAGFVAFLYNKLSVRWPVKLLLIHTQVFFGFHLVLFWWLLRRSLDWVPAAFYVWTGIYAVVIPTQVWILANQIFTVRQARRLFPLVSCGGIVGAALGGLLSHQLVRHIQTQNLPLACVPFLLACAGIVQRLTIPDASSWPKREVPSPSGGHRPHLHYLSLATLLVLFSTVLNSLVDYQFMSIVAEGFLSPDEMTAFFGAFSGYLAVVSLLMHLVVTGRLLRRFGLGLAIFVLPFSMLLGSSVLLVSAGLVTGVLIKGLDVAFRHTIDRSAIEMLYRPLPRRLRFRANSFIDMLASRGADCLAALLLYLLGSVWSFGAQQIGWANLILAVLWLSTAWMLRREYTRKLLHSAGSADTSAEALLASSEEPRSTPSSSEERAVDSGLVWWPKAPGPLGAEPCTPLTHPSGPIRRQAMALVAASDLPDCVPHVAKFLYMDNTVGALWQALDYLGRHDPQEVHVKQTDLLDAPYAVLRATAAAWLLAVSEPACTAKARGVLTQFLETVLERDPAIRRAAVELLGRIPADPAWQAALESFLHDPDPEVVRMAIVIAGRTLRRDLIPRLVELNGECRFRTVARQALASFGAGILPELNGFLLDARLHLQVRRNLPRVFSAIGGQAAADCLLTSLAQGDLELDYQMIRAIYRIQRQGTTARADSGRITPLVVGELRRYYRHLGVMRSLPQDEPHAGVNLLQQTLAGQLPRRLEIVFRLLGLIHRSKDVLHAYQRISSGGGGARANAVEFLDSMLRSPVRELLLPLVEDLPPERILEHARIEFGIEPPGYREALCELMADRDPWLQACAVYAAAEEGLPGVGPVLATLWDSGDPLLREPLRAARQRLGS